MTIFLWVLGGWYFLVICYFFYLAVMNLKRYRGDLGPLAKAFGYSGLALGLVLDLILTVVIGTVLFLAIPRDLTLTGRLKRHKAEGGWRGKIAEFICTKLLDQFDPSGSHCT